MCGHIFLINPGLPSLKPRQALWRCTTCGRQSQMPLDCCAHPAYHVAQKTSLVDIVQRRLSDLVHLGGRVYRIPIQLQSWLKRRRAPRGRLDAVVGMKSELDQSFEFELPSGEARPAAMALESTMGETLSVPSSDVEPGFEFDEEQTESPDRIHELQVH